MNNHKTKELSSNDKNLIVIKKNENELPNFNKGEY